MLWEDISSPTVTRLERYLIFRVQELCQDHQYSEQVPIIRTESSITSNNILIDLSEYHRTISEKKSAAKYFFDNYKIDDLKRSLQIWQEINNSARGMDRDATAMIPQLQAEIDNIPTGRNPEYDDETTALSINMKYSNIR